jgi:hypothetical protein
MLSFTVTLTNANQNYNLLTLVRALSAAFVDQGDFVIQADDDAGSQVYRIGDSTISSTAGTTMRAGDFSAHYKSLLNLYGRCDTAGKKLNIQVIR